MNQYIITYKGGITITPMIGIGKRNLIWTPKIIHELIQTRHGIELGFPFDVKSSMWKVKTTQLSAAYCA